MARPKNLDERDDACNNKGMTKGTSMGRLRSLGEKKLTEGAMSTLNL